MALIVALAGTAIAGPLATTSVLNKKEKKQTRNIARNEIKAAAPNLSVRSATNATSATSATSATNATNATNAANADQVDGHDAVCPAGTFLESGVCFDTAVRFPMVGWVSASQLCADAGGHLPTPSELQSIRDRVDLGPVGDGHWADAVWDDGGTLEALTVYGAAGALDVQPIINMNQARCAFELVR
ncbi:MAG: hypothetical protein ACXWEK_07675 [Solirubrobacterales bacterium]